MTLSQKIQKSLKKVLEDQSLKGERGLCVLVCRDLGVPITDDSFVYLFFRLCAKEFNFDTRVYKGYLSPPYTFTQTRKEFCEKVIEVLKDPTYLGRTLDGHNSDFNYFTSS